MQIDKERCDVLHSLLFGSLKMNLAATFWINCKGLIELVRRPDIKHAYKKKKLWGPRNAYKKKTKKKLWGPRNAAPKQQPPVLHEYLTHNNSLIEHAHSFSASRRRFRDCFCGNSRTQQQLQHWTLRRAALIFIYSLLKFNLTLSCIAIRVCT